MLFQVLSADLFLIYALHYCACTPLGAHPPCSLQMYVNDFNGLFCFHLITISVLGYSCVFSGVEASCSGPAPRRR